MLVMPPAGTSKAAERACPSRPASFLSFSRFLACARKRRVFALVEDYFHSKKHHLSDLMSMSVNAMYE